MTPDLTALVITHNEVANIARCLERLRWVPRVLVLDSFSTDETLAIARGFPNVEIVQRAFDTFANQCNHGLSLIESRWVLSLDCDYVLGDGFEKEALALMQRTEVNGWRAGFRYCIHGKPLSATLYPARCVLYVREAASYEDEGHGHRVRVRGLVGEMRARIDHDDRKPLSRWFASQIKYADKESAFLIKAKPSEMSRVDRIRRLGWVLPLIVPAYCLIAKGLWRDGIAGLHYTLQRWVAECMIALAVIERRISMKEDKA
jgi:glycosyltransferase involved in cell wall biosynthesis